MTRVTDGAVRWRKSSRSSGEDTCVELANVGAVRDSKNPAGPVLVVDVVAFLGVVRSGGLDR
jgi:hypothetical protein